MTSCHDHGNCELCDWQEARIIRLESELKRSIAAAEDVHNNINRPRSWDEWHAARDAARAALKGRDE